MFTFEHAEVVKLVWLDLTGLWDGSYNGLQRILSLPCFIEVLHRYEKYASNKYIATYYGYLL